jgi:hypothetical protein
MASLPNEGDKCDTDEKGETEENQVDGYGIVVECFVSGGVEGCLCEVEEAGETDDEAVDFAEGSEAEDFGGVVAAVQSVNNDVRVCRRGDLRNCGVVQWSVEDKEDDARVCGPRLRNDAQDTDGRRDGNKEGECEGCACVVEE